MKKPAPKLTPKAKRLIHDFGQASAENAWQQDQGTGSAVGRAATELITATEALETYVLKLQQKAKK